MMSASVKNSILSIVAALGVAFAGLAAAFPDKDLTMIVAFPPGGASDIIARPIAADLGKALGKSVIVVNKPGASGNLGAQALAQAQPDGHTLMLTAAAVSVAPALQEDPGFELFKNVQPLTIAGTVPFMLYVRASLPINSVNELFDYMRKNPGKLNYGSAGNGTIVHLAGELLKQKSGLNFVHIPFRGGIQAIQEMVAGNVDFMIDGGPHVVQQIEAGTIRLLAVTTKDRLAEYPKIPTLDESALPGYEVSTWQGIFVTGATPKKIVDLLNKNLVDIITSKESREHLAKLGVVPGGTSVSETESFVRSEMKKWAAVVKEANSKAR